MCRRLLFRVAVFAVVFAAICSVAAWVDDTASVGGSASADAVRQDETTHSAIAATAAVLVAASFLVTFGTYRRSRRTRGPEHGRPGTAAGRSTAGGHRQDGRHTRISPPADDAPVPSVQRVAPARPRSREVASALSAEEESIFSTE